MKKTAKKSIKKSTGAAQKAQSIIAPTVAVICLILGIFGLLLASLVDSELRPASTGTSSELKVIDGQGRSPEESSESAQSLQNAAQTGDFIEGQKGKTVQPGGSVDQLIGDRQIR